MNETRRFTGAFFEARETHLVFFYFTSVTTSITCLLQQKLVQNLWQCAELQEHMQFLLSSGKNLSKTNTLPLSKSPVTPYTVSSYCVW